MYSRPQILLMCAGLFGLMSLSGSAADDDPVKKKFLKSKEDYNASISKIRADTLAWFDKKESRARADGKKKLADELKLQRDQFDGSFAGSEEWPLEMPTDLQNRLQKSRTQFEAAYTTATKEYRKAKKEDDAAAVEKGLDELRRSFWPHLDLDRAEFQPGALGTFHIPSQTKIFTNKEHKGGIEITVVAKTEATDIRILAYRKSFVTFNREGKPYELFIWRPDGDEKGQDASITTARVTPLVPNTYYTLKWRLTPEGMTVSTNGEVVYSDKRKYLLDIETKIGLEAKKSAIDVREFKVTPVSK